MNALFFAVMIRASWRCCWCGCDLPTRSQNKADEPIVCKLDLSEGNDSLVASCTACNAMFRAWWPLGRLQWSSAAAMRYLARHDGIAVSGPFVDYLERVCPDEADPFAMALARIEDTRRRELDLIAGEKLAKQAA